VGLVGHMLHGLALKHPQHAVSDEEASEDVDRAERDRYHQQHLAEHAEVIRTQPEHHDPAEQDNAMDSVGPDINGVCSVLGTFEITEPDEAGQNQDRQIAQ
jgi:hypothetical protein